MGQIKWRKTRLLKTVTFLEGLLNISDSPTPEFIKQNPMLKKHYTGISAFLHLLCSTSNDNFRLIQKKLTVLEISPLSQCAGEKGPCSL